MRRTRGMTLIEIIVAIAILAITMTLVFGGLSQTMRNKQFIERQNDHVHVMRVAIDRMVREFSSAYVSIHTNPSSMLVTSMTLFKGEPRGRGSRIDFTSFSHRRLYRDAHESDQNELSYYITQHPDDSSKRVLARREQRRIDDKPDEGGQVTILIEDIKEFKLEFFDPVAQEWVERWDTQGAQMNRLPAQVKIKIVVPAFENSTRNETYVTRVAIPITYALNHAVYN